MVQLGALIIIVSVTFNFLYHFYLSRRMYKNRNLILSKDYLEKLFEETKSATDAFQGKNSEISIEEVTFFPEDFKITLDWKSLAEKLEEIKNQK